VFVFANLGVLALIAARHLLSELETRPHPALFEQFAPVPPGRQCRPNFELDTPTNTGGVPEKSELALGTG